MLGLHIIGPLHPLTILCEYTGEVDHSAKFDNSTSNSLMALILGEDTSNHLTVDGSKYSNVSRFINGINNNRDTTNSHRLNVGSARFCIDGAVHIIYFTCRRVSFGERLRVNYNNYLDEFPAHQFI